MNKEQVMQLSDLGKVQYPNEAFEHYQGMGMTSQRTRDRLIQRLIEEGIRHPLVLNAMRVTPRHLFLDEALASRSYEDTALPIGHGQTLSQPWVVAKMTEFLLSDQQAPQKVLEIGTGSGYQTTILALLFKEVYTLERLEALMLKAQQVLQKLAVHNVQFALSDGHWGWPRQSRDKLSGTPQFDAILSAAAPDRVPQALFDQLKVGGRMVMPIGKEKDTQDLMGYYKTKQGIKATLLGKVLFVPMLDGIEKQGGAV